MCNLELSVALAVRMQCIQCIAGGFALLRLALASQALIIIMARKVPFLKHSHTLLNDDRLFIPPWVNITAHTPLMLGSWISTVYGRTIAEYIHQDSKLLDLVVFFAELSNMPFGPIQSVSIYTVQEGINSISGQTSQDRIKCTYS